MLECRTDEFDLQKRGVLSCVFFPSFFLFFCLTKQSLLIMHQIGKLS